jgi:DNA-binding CsgD family transcriptional regulator
MRHPTPPSSLQVRRVLVKEGLWVVEGIIDYGDGRVFDVVVISRLKEGKMWRDRWASRSRSRHRSGGLSGSSGWNPEVRQAQLSSGDPGDGSYYHRPARAESVQRTGRDRSRDPGPRRLRSGVFTEAAERWLRDLADLGEGWQEGEGLPAPVWMVVGALRKALKPEPDRDLNGVPSVRVQTRSGRWLTFHGARTEPRPGRRNETMVIIEPSRPQEPAWLRASAYGLSEREREVVDLVVQGASTREISQTLYISEYTVQEHLSNVFDKVGVRGRRALIKRLFFDNLYPELLG